MTRRDRAVDYAAAVSDAVAKLESGEHPLARQALLKALSVDRNEPCGLMAAATLALHTGDGKRAERILERAKAADPESPLPDLGLTLARLLQNDLAGAALYAEGEPDLRAYLRLMRGEGSVMQTLAPVGPDEPDAFRLQLAGMAALRAGDRDRGVRLLKALLARPEWAACEESRAVALPFTGRRLAEGNAVAVEPIALPDAPPSAPRLAGEASLTPGRVPPGTAMVTYAIPGTYTATTNSAPFVASWNTHRCANGLYTLIVTFCNADGDALSETRRVVRVANAVSLPSTRLTPEQQTSLSERLRALLLPRPSRKAAHFALAEEAIRRGDSAEALARIESVVAIDPVFQGAYASLKQYNQRYVGVGNGYWRGQTQEKLVAFTFDDGPNPLKWKTPALLDTLRNQSVKATFFVVGARAEANPDLIRRMDTEGHEIANHSYTHPNLTFLEPNAVRKELCRTSVVVRDITGKRPRFYRPPGGNFNGATADAASTLGMHGAYWTVDGYKLENPPFTAADLTQFVLKKVRPGSIVLLHNAPDNTILALPEIFRALRDQGYEFVTMTELVHRSSLPRAAEGVAVSAAGGAPKRAREQTKK